MPPCDLAVTIRYDKEMIPSIPFANSALKAFMIRDLFFFSLLILGGLQATCQADESRPHIVMAFADDWGKYASAYAALEPGGISDLVETPHFDAVANEGILFTRAFVSAPSCTPCRSSLLSGQHFWRCDRASILQGAIWDMSIPSYPLILEEDGYRIGHTYKVWSPGSPVDAPHGGKDRRFVSQGRKFNRFSQVAMAAGDHEAGKAELLAEIRGNIRSFLDSDGDGTLDGDQPICYWLGPTNCHRKWIAGSGKELWGIDPDDLKGKLPAYLPDVATVREDIADYLGEVQAFDAGLGVLREELQRVGIADETVLVVSGDHGIPGIPRGKCNLYDLGTQVPLAIRAPGRIKNPGRVVDDFVSLPDLAPTFLELAGSRQPETMIARSLVPIFASEKSGQVDPDRDAVFTGRERHVAQARTGNKPYPQRAIRTGRYLYIINFEPDRWPMGTAPGFGEEPGPMPSYEVLREKTFAAFADLDASPTKAWVIDHRQEAPKYFEYAVSRRPKHELYDLRRDPDCLENLAESDDHRTTRRQLHDRLMEELRSTGDPRVVGELIYERPPFAGD